MQNVSQLGATLICLVVAGQVFQPTAVRNIDDVLSSAGSSSFTQADVRNMVAGTQSALFQSLDGGARAAVIAAVISAMRLAFAIPLVAGGLGVICAVGMRRERLFE